MLVTYGTDGVMKSYNPFMRTFSYLRMCRTPDRKRVVGAWWLYEEVNNRFPLNKGWEPPDTPSPPLHEIRSVPSKGRGLFATWDIKQNDVIIRERPILMTPRIVMGATGGHEYLSLDANLLQLLYWLDKEDREKVLQLHNCKPLYEGGPLSGILRTNAVDALFPDASISKEHGAVCLNISYANHDCNPNSEWYFEEAEVTMVLRARRNISAGEEITITYTNPAASHEDRQRELKELYDFTCTCTRCFTEAKSIERQRFIYTTLDDYVRQWDHFFSNPTPEKAKRDIELMEQVLRAMDGENIHDRAARFIPVEKIALLYACLGYVDDYRKWASEAARLEVQMKDMEGTKEWHLWAINPRLNPAWDLFSNLASRK